MRRALTVAVACLIGVAAATPAHAAPGPAAGRHGSIAFTYRDQIYTISTDGSGRRQLTTDGKNYRASWSPDGSRLAYIHEDSKGSRDIWTMRADGSQKQQVTTGHGISGAASWSPDGRRLLIANNGFVSTITLANKDVRAVTACFDEEPDYTDHPVGTPCQIDQDVLQLQAQGSPAWSPDGRYIVLTSPGTVAKQLVEVWSGNGKSIHINAQEGGGGSKGSFGTTYSWAPDSRSFLVPHASSPGRSLISSYSLQLPGSHAPTVTSVRGDSQPSYSPDGSQLAVLNSAGGTSHIYVSRLDGTGRHQLVAGYQPAWQPR